MQVNTREAMLRAFKLRQKFGSWEEVERAGNATQFSLEVFLGAPLDDQAQPGNPPAE